jgi:2-polyprenyl-6-methoxyphenol hydroxylase-like FAD-dependent oxidoreductase
MERADVVIVGGGFAGLCAARAVAKSAFCRGSQVPKRVLILEARTGQDPRFRGELIHPPGVRILEELGLHASLRDAGGADVDGFAVVLENAVPPIVLPYAEVRGGHRYGLAISHPDMVARLRREVTRTDGDAAVEPIVELRTGARVAELLKENDRVVGVRTADGEIRAPLTIVAEGRHSKLRRALGFADETRLLSFTAALLVEGGELPRPAYGHVFLGVHGPILAYAIGGGRVRMCVDVPCDVDKGQAAVAAFLRAECAPSVPEPLRTAMLRALVEAPPEICANHAIKTHRCAGKGVALVGDSGGCSHPLTAAGMTIALNDIRTLTRELSRGADSADLADLADAERIDGALERYQAARYDFVRAREILADGLYDVFRRGDDGARAVRSGLSRYWTSGARARAASLALLSGQESRMRAFVAEYLWVVGESAVSVLGGALDTAIPGGRRAALTGLARTAVDQLQRTVSLVYTELLRRATPKTRLGDPVAARPMEPEAEAPGPS